MGLDRFELAGIRIDRKVRQAVVAAAMIEPSF
jgi:hypothetical protein